MKKLSEPKYVLWICRLLPIVCIPLMGILALVDFNIVGWAPALMLLIFIIYGSFILWYLPILLFEGNCRRVRLIIGISSSDPWWYAPFAIFTFGIGPLIWYWLKIDHILAAMCNKENKDKFTK